jgi:hypothetical protein
MHARGIGAVVASKDREVPSYVGKLADLHGLDPRAVHAKGDVVF